MTSSTRATEPEHLVRHPSPNEQESTMYDNNPEHIDPAGHDYDDDPTPPTHPEGPRALADPQVSEIVTLDLSNTSQRSEASPTCNHLHYGDENDPNVNLDCPWAPLMNNYETALNTADHPLAAREIGEILSSEDLQLGIDRIDFMTQPWGLREGAEWEFDKTTRHNNHQPGYAMETTRILSGGQSIRLWYRQPADNTPPLLIVRSNPSQNRSLATIDQALEIGQEAWDNVGELVIHTGTFADAAILNIDIAADFSPVADLNGLLRTLNHVRPMPRWSKKHFKSVGPTGGITVEHFTKTTGAMTIYNKSAQASLDTPTIRFEAKVFKAARKRFGLQHIFEISEDAVRPAFDHLVSQFRQALQSQLALDPAIDHFGQRRLIEAIGYLYCTSNGVPLEVSRERRYLLHKILKDMGVTGLDDLAA